MKYIFVTGMGRSGTVTVARALGCLRNARVGHETIGDREFWLLSWYQDASVYAIPYLEAARRDIEFATSEEYFIDVNGYLQHAVEPLRTVFEPRAVFHLVRDGRAVVRSLYSRRVEDRTHVLPKSREGFEAWMSWDRFERICWNWAQTTTALIQQGTTLIKFERLAKDFSYFSGNLLEPFGFELTEAQWQRAFAQKANRTRSPWRRFWYAKLRGKPYISERLPVYEEWAPELKATFKSICGEAMELAGYDIGSPLN